MNRKNGCRNEIPNDRPAVNIFLSKKKSGGPKLRRYAPSHLPQLSDYATQFPNRPFTSLQNFTLIPARNSSVRPLAATTQLQSGRGHPTVSISSHTTFRQSLKHHGDGYHQGRVFSETGRMRMCGRKLNVEPKVRSPPHSLIFIPL